MVLASCSSDDRRRWAQRVASHVGPLDKSSVSVGLVRIIGEEVFPIIREPDGEVAPEPIPVACVRSASAGQAYMDMGMA